jgi:hypothetical protein
MTSEDGTSVPSFFCLKTLFNPSVNLVMGEFLKRIIRGNIPRLKEAACKKAE